MTINELVILLIETDGLKICQYIFSVIIFIIFTIIIITVMSEIAALIFYEIPKCRKNKLFDQYIPNMALQEDVFKKIDFGKEYIIITDDFFDNVYTHRKDFYTKMSNYKKRFILNMHLDYNIIIACTKCNEYDTKFYNIVRFCKWNNLPICRMIIGLPKGVEKQYWKDDKSGDIVLYYKKEV